MKFFLLATFVAIIIAVAMSFTPPYPLLSPSIDHSNTANSLHAKAKCGKKGAQTPMQ
jgi:hypothetical protein